MIKFGITVENPWSDRFDPGYAWAGKLFKYKAWEFQAYRSNAIAEVCVEFTHRQDHAGLKIELGLFSFNFVAQIYDSRHWNYNKKQWEVYDDQETILR